MDFEQLKRRTKEFAHRCVKLALALPDTKLGRHIQSLMKKELVEPLLSEAKELTSIFIASRKTAQRNISLNNSQILKSKNS